MYQTDLQILKQPQSNLLCEYRGQVVLSLCAVGYGHLTYQWKQDEKDITYPECVGSNSDTLTINSFFPKHQGNYTCVVSEREKSVKSEPAKLILGIIMLTFLYLLIDMI